MKIRTSDKKRWELCPECIENPRKNTWYAIAWRDGSGLFSVSFRPTDHDIDDICDRLVTKIVERDPEYYAVDQTDSDIVAITQYTTEGKPYVSDQLQIRRIFQVLEVQKWNQN